jgi:hypothetical protein
VPIPGATGLQNAAGAGCSLTASAPLCPGAGPYESSAKTGCFLWAAGQTKPSGFFRVRVTATDKRGIQTVRSTVPPLNAYDTSPSHRLRFLAGNTDPGLGGNARATFFNNQVTSKLNTYDAGSLAVSSSGIVYFRDPENGVLWIDPATGNVERLLALGPSSTGDGGPVRAAAAIGLGSIALNFQDELLVWEIDPTNVSVARIRRVTLDARGLPDRILPFLGGGSDLSGNGVAPSAVQLANCKNCELIPMPNGDVFVYPGFVVYPQLSSNNGFRIYRAATGTVDTIIPHGTGYAADGARDVATCGWEKPSVEFDPQSGALLRIHASSSPNYAGNTCGFGRLTMTPDGQSVTAISEAHQALPTGSYGEWWLMYRTGKDGSVYGWDSSGSGQLARYVRGSNSWTPVLGLPGVTDDNCPDGTEALLCQSEINDFFVDALGGIFYTALGALRTIVTSFEDSGGGVFVQKDRVRTIAGQGMYFGDGGDALSARISYISSAKPWGSSPKRVVLTDVTNRYLREATLGGNIDALAGDGGSGALVIDADALSSSVAPNIRTRVMVDPVSGRVHSALSATNIVYLERGTPNTWRRLAGGPPGGSWYSITDPAQGPAGTGSNIADATTLSWSYVSIDPTPAWAPATSYALGDSVANGGNIYAITVAGMSAGGGGPSGTSGAIIDGGATWTYFGTASSVTPWAPSTAYASGALVRNSAKIYRAETAGTSAPSGTDATGVDLYWFNVFGLTANEVIYSHSRIESTGPLYGRWVDGMMKRYSLNTTPSIQQTFIGLAGDDNTPTFCADGVARDQCSWTGNQTGLLTEPSYDDRGTATLSDDRWVTTEWDPLYSAAYRVLRTLPAYDGTEAVGTLTTLPRSFTSFAHVRRPDLGGAEIVYYCSDDGLIHRWDVASSSDTILAWPIEAMKCSGASMVWDAAQKSLTFPYRQAGMFGVVEYLDVP